MDSSDSYVLTINLSFITQSFVISLHFLDFQQRPPTSSISKSLLSLSRQWLHLQSTHPILLKAAFPSDPQLWSMFQPLTLTFRLQFHIFTIQPPPTAHLEQNALSTSSPTPNPTSLPSSPTSVEFDFCSSPLSPPLLSLTRLRIKTATASILSIKQVC